MKVLINLLLDLFFPAYCTMCKKRGTELCQECSGKLPYPDQTDMHDIFACFQYHDPVIKKLLHMLKYYKRKNVGILLGTYMYERLIEEISELRTFSEGSNIILIPVPITKKRLHERGYNQAELIAKGMIQKDSEKIFELGRNIIYKNKDTLPQARIKNRNKRLKNIVGCFSLNDKNFVKNKTVIIIDDVTTTGGTINEVMHMLKKSGAKKVVGFAIAH